MPPQDVESLENTAKIIKKSEATIKIPFATEEKANIVYRVLSVDEEPKRGGVEKDFYLDGDQLVVSFTADQAKFVRNAITSYFDRVLLCQQVLEAFSDEPKPEENKPEAQENESETEENEIETDKNYPETELAEDEKIDSKDNGGALTSSNSA